jgi:hypothetical protein
MVKLVFRPGIDLHEKRLAAPFRARSERMEKTMVAVPHLESQRPKTRGTVGQELEKQHQKKGDQNGSGFSKSVPYGPEKRFRPGIFSCPGRERHLLPAPRPVPEPGPAGRVELPGVSDTFQPYRLESERFSYFHGKEPRKKNEPPGNTPASSPAPSRFGCRQTGFEIEYIMKTRSRLIKFQVPRSRGA